MLSEKINSLPELPGVYRYFDEAGTIIYVGKATSLKSRVKSYFTGTNNTKTQALVSHIRDIEFTVTDNAVEALFLENTLIKKYQPKYNILLKDDKTYPYIKITNEKYPRIITARKVEKDGAKYFGPYPSDGIASSFIKVIHELFPIVKLSNCGKKEKCLSCLYYHTRSCIAPYADELEEHVYPDMMRSISKFLSGEQKEVLLSLEQKMSKASEEMNFEMAAQIRDQITTIKKMNDKQKMLISSKDNIDIVHYSFKDGHLSLFVFFVRSGVLLDTFHQTVESSFDEQVAFLEAFEQFYIQKEDTPKEVYLPFMFDSEVFEVKKMRPILPKRGEKSKLLELARKNAEVNLTNYLSKKSRNERHTSIALRELAEVLKIDIPRRIEMFDNSNIQGESPVSAMVCFIDGTPSKNDYRKFKIRSVVGADDYHTMQEVIERRYSRAIKEGTQLPDLIIVDGGKPQVSAAHSILFELGLSHIPLIGIGKDEKHRSSYVINRQDCIYDFSKAINAFNLLTRIQDEVHRFAITFFRKTHSKSALSSILDEIEGVGEKRRKLLLTHFKSVKAIREATISDIETLGIPRIVAEKILQKLKEEE